MSANKYFKIQINYIQQKVNFSSDLTTQGDKASERASKGAQQQQTAPEQSPGKKKTFGFTYGHTHNSIQQCI